MKVSRSLFTAAFAVSALSSSLYAQDAGGNDTRGGRGGRGGDPSEMRQRMEERIKGGLKVSDEEWTVLQPLIEGVTSKQRDVMGGMFGRGRGGNGPGGQGGNQGGNEPSRPGQQEREALRTAVENESATPEDLKAKMTAVREQRKKAQAGLTQAREELRKVLTVRQEAVLVSYGILE